MKLVAMSLVLYGLLHETAWTHVPAEWQMQRDVRDVTQWGLILSMALVIHLLARSRAVSAACAALAVMSSTTALCAAAWMLDNTIRSCSSTLQVPLILLSLAAGCTVFYFLGEPDGDRG